MVNTCAFHKAVDEILAEYTGVVARHDSFASAHEGWATIYEEVDELWDEVRKRVKSSEAMRKEARQVAATAIRFMIEVANRDEYSTRPKA